MISAPSRIARSVCAAASRFQESISTTFLPDARSCARYAASCSSPLRRIRSACGLSTCGCSRTPRATSSSSAVKCSHSRKLFRAEGERRTLQNRMEWLPNLRRQQLEKRTRRDDPQIGQLELEQVVVAADEYRSAGGTRERDE